MNQDIRMKPFRKKVETIPKRVLLLSFKQTMRSKKKMLSLNLFLVCMVVVSKKVKRKQGIKQFFYLVKTDVRWNKLILLLNFSKLFILFSLYFNKISRSRLFLFAVMFCSPGYWSQDQSMSHVGVFRPVCGLQAGDGWQNQSTFL